MKRKLWIGIAVSAVFLAYFLWGIDFAKVGQAFAEANYWLLFPAVAGNVLSFVIRAERWRHLMQPIKRIRLGPLFSATCIGYMATNILPFRVGELVRPYALGEIEGVDKSAAMATVVVERIFDLVMILVLFAGCILFSDIPRLVAAQNPGTHKALIWAGRTVAGVCLVLLGALVFLLLKKELFLRLCRGLMRPLPERFSARVLELLGSFAEGLAILRRPTNMIYTAIWSLILWLVYAAGAWIMFFAFPEMRRLPFAAGAFIIVVVAFGISIPSAPGFIGPFHAACALAAMVLNVPDAVAKSYAILLWANAVMPVTVLGFIYLFKENMSFRQIKAAGEAGRGPA